MRALIHSSACGGIVLIFVAMAVVGTWLEGSCAWRICWLWVLSSIVASTSAVCLVVKATSMMGSSIAHVAMDRLSRAATHVVHL